VSPSRPRSAGAPEQGVTDGQGHVYVVIQDKANVAVIDAKAMKVTAHYDFGDKGSRCNGLALDAKNHVLFAACGQSGIPPVTPAQPMMVILDADDGKIITSLPLAGSSDGAVFNPATMEVFSSHGNGTMTIVKEKSPTSFEVEQNLRTMAGACAATTWSSLTMPSRLKTSRIRSIRSALCFFASIDR
jgi:DNA-binding beta-propeller fold protein YncE